MIRIDSLRRLFCGKLIMDYAEDGVHDGKCPHLIFSGDSSTSDLTEMEQWIDPLDIPDSVCFRVCTTFVMGVDGYFGFCQHTEEALAKRSQQ